MIDLNTLHPFLQPLCEKWLENCKLAGLKLRVIHAWRDPVYQDKLYAQGRTQPGNIVTWATSAKSLHCFTENNRPAAKAFDFAVFDEHNAYVTDGTDARYTLAGDIGKALGLHWGGDFSGNKKDYDHLELRSSHNA